MNERVDLFDRKVGIRLHHGEMPDYFKLELKSAMAYANSILDSKGWISWEKLGEIFYFPVEIEDVLSTNIYPKRPGYKLDYILTETPLGFTIQFKEVKDERTKNPA